MADPFARMHDRLFSRLGEQAVLHQQSITVALEHGVAISGEYGEVVAHRTVAMIPSAAVPVVGDALTVGQHSYVIDAIERNDGYTVRAVLR